MPGPQKKKWKKVLPTITLTAIPFTAMCPEANAFFPPVVPPPPKVVVVPPVSPPPVIVVPPVSPPPFSPPPSPPVVVPPVSPPPIVVPPVSPPHNTTPEPTTFIISAIGLAAVAGSRLLRKNTKGQAEEGKSIE